MLAWIVIGTVAGAVGVAVGRSALPRGHATRVQRRWERRLVDRRLRHQGIDPFSTLSLQVRLGELARELDVLHSPADVRFAAAHHLRAAQLAYDALLDEACRLAEVGPIEGHGSVHRLLAESALRGQGWTW